MFKNNMAALKLAYHACIPFMRMYMYGLLMLAVLMCLGSPMVWAQRAESFDSPKKSLEMADAIPRNFPAHAKRGTIRFLTAPEVRINGKRSRLSPSSRIMDPRNMRLNAHLLKGKNFKVMYTQDTMRQLADVWILSKFEMQRPSMQKQREQYLRSQGINPKMFDIDPLTPYHKLPKYPAY